MVVDNVVLVFVKSCSFYRLEKFWDSYYNVIFICILIKLVVEKGGVIMFSGCAFLSVYVWGCYVCEFMFFCVVVG